jgi:cytochrome c peroxidase
VNAPQRTQTAQSVTTSGAGAVSEHFESGAQPILDFLEGQRLFERETFGGNGRTCLTCHSRETGTVSPQEARLRFRNDKDDPLFVHDGSDDDNGDGFGDGRHVTRMLRDATVLMRIHLHPDVEVKDHPEIRR